MSHHSTDQTIIENPDLPVDELTMQPVELEIQTAHVGPNEPTEGGLTEETTADLKRRVQEIAQGGGAQPDESPDDTDTLGPTGCHPAGELGPNDGGEIRFGIAHAVTESGPKVFVDFGTPIRSLGMTPDEADAFAQSLLERARQARNAARL